MALGNDPTQRKPRIDAEEELFGPPEKKPQAAKGQGGQKVQIGIRILKTTKQRLAQYCLDNDLKMNTVVSELIEDLLRKGKA